MNQAKLIFNSSQLTQSPTGRSEGDIVRICGRKKLMKISQKFMTKNQPWYPKDHDIYNFLKLRFNCQI